MHMFTKKSPKYEFGLSKRLFRRGNCPLEEEPSLKPITSHLLKHERCSSLYSASASQLVLKFVDPVITRSGVLYESTSFSPVMTTSSYKGQLWNRNIIRKPYMTMNGNQLRCKKWKDCLIHASKRHQYSITKANKLQINITKLTLGRLSKTSSTTCYKISSSLINQLKKWAKKK